METTTSDSTTVERANEMYWGSGRSVNQIADELDLSKGALYEALLPEPAGVACPECTEEVGYANRTAKEKGVTICSACAWEGDLIDTVRLRTEPSPDDPPLPVARPRLDLVPPDEEDGIDRTPPPPFPEVPVRVIAGGALLGAAVGLAMVLWARRR